VSSCLIDCPVSRSARVSVPRRPPGQRATTSRSGPGRHDAVAGDPRAATQTVTPASATISHVSAETPSWPPRSRAAQAPRGRRLDHDQARRPRSHRPGQPGHHLDQLPRSSRPYHSGAGIGGPDDRRWPPGDRTIFLSPGGSACRRAVVLLVSGLAGQGYQVVSNAGRSTEDADGCQLHCGLGN
jgi:hypothetical protein